MPLSTIFQLYRVAAVNIIDGGNWSTLRKSLTDKITQCIKYASPCTMSGIQTYNLSGDRL